MNARQESSFEELPEECMLRINQCCNRFETAWQSGTQPSLEEALHEFEPEHHLAALEELLPLEIEYRQQAGESLAVEDYALRFPQFDRNRLAQLIAAESSADPADADMPDKLGDYKILSRLGAGGMGTVYKAMHERMGRLVAVKVLRPELQQNQHLLHRFDREVRAAARLSHPNIVAALDAREQDGVHFLVTEYVEGADLDEIVRRSGPLNMAEAVDCLIQAARGLDYAHQHGVVHRDIKPANLLRDSQGMVKILDMGLARLDTPDDPTATELTKSGMVMGTAAYMAPEQARDTRRADARSDVYSLGCTLYFLLTGRPVYQAETQVDTILSHINTPVPSLMSATSATPRGLEAIFRRMVAKNPQDRFQSAAEVATSLETFLSEGEFETAPLPDPSERVTARLAPTAMLERTVVGEDLSPPPPSAPDASDPASNNRWLLAVGGLATLAVALLVYANWSDAPQENPPIPPQVASTADDYVLEFNGRSSYVRVADLTPVAGESYTLEAIVRPSFRRTSNMISWLGPDWMALYMTESQWGVGRRVGEESHLIAAAQVPQLGERVHLAGTAVGAELRLFVNGVLADVNGSGFALPETTGGLCIGGVPRELLPEDQNDRFFGGTIYGVRISRGVRYTESFDPPTVLSQDQATIATFTFDAGQGTQVIGSGDRAWQGEINNATWQRTPADAE